MLFICMRRSWLVTWMGFELGLIGFLPLFSVENRVISSIVKYLLIQAGGSAIFLVSYLLGIHWLSGVLLLVRMLMKVGLFPFFQ